MSDERQSIGRNLPGPIKELIGRPGVALTTVGSGVASLAHRPCYGLAARALLRTVVRRNALRVTCAELP